MIKPLISMIIQTHWTQQFLIVTQNLIFINHLYYLMFTYELLSMLHGNTFFWNDEIAVFFSLLQAMSQAMGPWMSAFRWGGRGSGLGKQLGRRGRGLGDPGSAGCPWCGNVMNSQQKAGYNDIYIHILVLKVFILMCIYIYICNYIVIWINYIESGGYNCRYV